MAVNRIELIGLTALILTASLTIALAQNTSNPLRSGNTTNPRLSGNTVTQPPEVPVSPALPTTILTPTIGRNSITGLPCSGSGALVVPGPGAAAGTTAAPGATPLPQNGGPVTPPPTSVFGSSPAC
jgi:hypothetical protein